MRAAGTIQLRLSGESVMIAAIFVGLQGRIPRGPRGGSLYRLSLKENTDGVSSRLYCDLPMAVFADLFQGVEVPRPQDRDFPVVAAPGATYPAGPAPGFQQSRYDIGYTRGRTTDPRELP